MFAEAFPSNINENSLSALVRIMRAKDACKKYMEARNMASSEGNAQSWLSSTKNYGMTCFRIVSMSEFQERNGKEDISYYFKESIHHLREALENGRRISMEEEWIYLIEQKISEVIYEIFKYNLSYIHDGWKARIGLLSSMMNMFHGMHYAEARFHIEIANEMFKFICQETSSAINILSTLYDMKQPMMVATQLLKTCAAPDYDELVMTLDELSGSVEYYECRARSEIKRLNADDLMVHLCFDDENFDVDFAWIVLDTYNQAIVEASVCNVNLEPTVVCHESAGRACISMGIFCHKVLKLKKEGHKRLLMGIQHIDVVTHTDGRTFFSQTWYIEAHALIKKYRDDIAAFDAAEIAKQRAPILEKIKPQLDAMLAAIESSQSNIYR